MRVLVIGGAGYIGSHAVRKLIEEGNNVVVLDSLYTERLLIKRLNFTKAISKILT